jgi:cell division protein FtsZ
MKSPDLAEVVAMNSDAQSLASAVAPRKSNLGPRATRGLGAGGDPEVGFEAAQESLEEIRFAVEASSSVILLVGLGGGTGSGAAPVVAEAAKEAGAFVLALVTTPFSFEGRRRAAQAAEAEAALQKHAHAVIRFENDRMADLSSPREGIRETFEAADRLLTECVASFLEMLNGDGPMPVTLGNLLSVLREGSPSALFGRGEGLGDNRAHEAVERALKSPLLDRGRMLDDARAVIVHVGGPPSLSFSETAAIMRETSKHVPDDANLFLSVSATQSASSPLTVTIFGNHDGGSPPSPPARTARPAPEPRAVPEFTPPKVIKKDIPPPAAPEKSDDPLRPSPPGRLFADADEPTPPKPNLPVSFAAPATAGSPPTPTTPVKKTPPTKVRQETLQFEPAARGRFEKSEPTIVEGEDLDVPTFLRARPKT